MASNEQHAQLLESLARYKRQVGDAYRSGGRHESMVQTTYDQAEACEAGAACLRREAAYHERLARAIGAVPHEIPLSADSGKVAP